MTPERVAELRTRYPSLKFVGELADEIERLTGRPAEYVDWEPTVKEEYDHACDRLRLVQEVVKAFDTGPKLAVSEFAASLKHALEMP